jgi:protein TonB
MLRLLVFLLLSLAVHVTASRLLHAPAAPPALTQAPEAPQVLRLAALQQVPAPQPPILTPQPQPQSSTPAVVKPVKPRAPKAAAPPGPAMAERVEPVPQQPAKAAAPPPRVPVAQVEPLREVFSREPSFREPPRPPRYPAQARRRNQQGTVMVEVRLNERGEQRGVSVLRSSGIDSLDRAALDAVSAWHFRPETAGGRAVPSRVQIPIQFALTASR